MGYRNSDDEVIIGRQVLLRLRGYISVCPTLQLSHNDVGGVGLGRVLEGGGPESFALGRMSLGGQNITSLNSIPHRHVTTSRPLNRFRRSKHPFRLPRT